MVEDIMKVTSVQNVIKKEECKVKIFKGVYGEHKKYWKNQWKTTNKYKQTKKEEDYRINLFKKNNGCEY